MIKIFVTCLGLDSTSLKFHPDAASALKKMPNPPANHEAGLTRKIHMVAANDRLGLTFFLSPGQAEDAQNGRYLLHNWRHSLPKNQLAMDRAYEGNQTRECVAEARGRLTTKIHLLAANNRLGLTFCLSPGQAEDAQYGRRLLHNWRHSLPKIPLAMDRACEGNEIRECVAEWGVDSVVPPKSNRLKPWIYDKTTHKRRNEIERLFRRLKAFRRIFSRFEKLDLMLTAFIHIALMMEMINSVNTP